MSASQRGRSALGSVIVIAPALWLSVQALAQGPPSPPVSVFSAQDQFEGQLDVHVEDSDRGSRVHHFLTTDSGRRLRLEMTGDGPGWLSGTRVRARGRLKDEVTLELGADGGLEPMALANPNTLGEQLTLVMLVNFQDSPQIPYDWSYADAVTFDTTSRFFLENSDGQSWLTGAVVGWFTLALDSTTCDYNQISSLADQAATSAGVRLSDYARKVYAFPQTGACPWWGLGTVGGTPSRAWINGAYTLKVVAHELGHNFGAYHSRSKTCDAGGCAVSEYGDEADVMGNPSSGHLNAFQKERLGWLNYGDTPAIASVQESGTYWIDAYAPMDAGASAPKALKILKEIDGSGRRTWYYVETRAQAGFDSGLVPGVILHTGSEVSAREVYELDLLPAVGEADWRLDAGQTFEDAVLGVRVGTLWSDATGAMIDVQFAAAPCTASQPDLLVTPESAVTTDAGVPVAYSVGVTNLDEPSCGSSTFVVEAWVPSGWSWSSSPASLSVAAGAVASTTVTVTPPAAAMGTTDIQIGAYRASGPGASVVRTIQVSQVPAPGPLDVALAVSATRLGFDISAVVRADDNPVSGASVTFVITDPVGLVRTVTSTTDGSGQASMRFKPRRKDPTGIYTVQATATSGGRTGVATASFIVD